MKEDNTTIDLQKIEHICSKCNKKMDFHTTEEIENENGIMLFLVYMCPVCEDNIWILDKEKQYYKELYDHLSNNPPSSR